jgi:3-oxoacyl-[acyl-carrier-protein] synthase II
LILTSDSTTVNEQRPVSDQRRSVTKQEQRMRDVAITGIGVISCIGQCAEDYFRNLDAGRHGVTEAPWSEPENGRIAWIAPVPDFDPAAWMDQRVADGSATFTQYALAAAAQAVRDAGEDFDPVRTGVVLGVTMAGAHALLDAQHLLDTQGPDAVPRKLNIQVWPNMAAAQVAIGYKLHGPLLTVSTACASSLDAIGAGARMISSGEADVIIAGGTEHGLSPALAYSQRAYGMSVPADRADRASLPFDVHRSGVVEGAGAAVVVLESASRAAARGARVYGQVAGYASLSEGFHPSSPQPDGRWEVETMRRAQLDAGLAGPGDVDAVIAHATATPVGDLAEAMALNEVFGEYAAELPVMSIKGHVGHTGSASGAMGLLAGLYGMQAGTLAPTAGTTEVEPEARFRVVTGAPAKVDIDVLQVNGFGFGGQDACLIATRA